MNFTILIFRVFFLKQIAIFFKFEIDRIWVSFKHALGSRSLLLNSYDSIGFYFLDLNTEVVTSFAILIITIDERSHHQYVAHQNDPVVETLEINQDAAEVKVMIDTDQVLVEIVLHHVIFPKAEVDVAGKKDPCHHYHHHKFQWVIVISIWDHHQFIPNQMFTIAIIRRIIWVDICKINSIQIMIIKYLFYNNRHQDLMLTLHLLWCSQFLQVNNNVDQLL